VLAIGFFVKEQGRKIGSMSEAFQKEGKLYHSLFIIGS